MDVLFHTAPPFQWSAAALIVFVPEPRIAKNAKGAAPDFAPTRPLLRPGALCPDLLETAPWLSGNPALTDISGTANEICVVHGTAGASIARVLFVGLGKPDEVETGYLLTDALRRAAGSAAAHCRELGLTDMAFALPCLESLAPDNLPRLVEEAVFGALQGLYRYTQWKTRQAGDPPQTADPLRLTVLASADKPMHPTGELTLSVQEAAQRGQAAAVAVALTRNLINGPANQVTPTFLATEATRIARVHGQKCEVLTPDQLDGMGAFKAVAAGSSQQARLLILEHAPKGHEEEPPLVVVGKGLTFDSGGISLKPAAGMESLKDDMAGAAAVLGLFDALGTLNVPRRVVGLMPCAENMPDANATRPGDVVTTLSGKTVEIVNTDAEGRLVLCDTLTYAQRRWKPALLLDVATLTGACVVALGSDVAGLFCNDPAVAERIREAGRRVGEAYWPLPLEKRFFGQLKSDTADFANSGGREGGACSAAIFLKQFIEDGVTWAHLDIAGPAFRKQKSPCAPSGAVGFAVRTFLELALR